MTGKKVALDKSNRVIFDTKNPDSANYFLLAWYYLKDYAQMCNQYKDGIAPLPEGYEGSEGKEPISVEQVALFMKGVLYLSSVDIPGESDDINLVDFFSISAEFLYSLEDNA